MTQPDFGYCLSAAESWLQDAIELCRDDPFRLMLMSVVMGILREIENPS
jgi:hypothetical protein